MRRLLLVVARRVAGPLLQRLAALKGKHLGAVCPLGGEPQGGILLLGSLAHHAAPILAAALAVAVSCPLAYVAAVLALGKPCRRHRGGGLLGCRGGRGLLRVAAPAWPCCCRRRFLSGLHAWLGSVGSGGPVGAGDGRLNVSVGGRQCLAGGGGRALLRLRRCEGRGALFVIVKHSGSKDTAAGVQSERGGGGFHSWLRSGARSRCAKLSIRTSVSPQAQWRLQVPLASKLVARARKQPLAAVPVPL